jgi:protease-4
MVRTDTLTSAWTAAYVVAVVLALVTATVLAPVVWSVASVPAGDDPTVAVITLRGGTDDVNVNRVSAQLRQARENPSVEAVVLRIDSPGGPVDSSEELYLAVNRTANELPVVAYVEGLAASGGYYGIAPADGIVVKSSSTVGSIGVIVQAPLSAVEAVERQRGTFLRTGPDKAQITVDGIRGELELLQRAFVSTIMTHRGDELTLSRAEVASADTYLGPEAVENGFADRIGDLDLAIQQAAETADGINGDRYDVEYLGTASGVGGPGANIKGEIQRVEGNVVYVTTERQEFVRPVRYWAVWGIPTNSVGNGTENATIAGGGSR